MDPSASSGDTATATAEPQTEDQIGHALRDLAAGHPEFRFFRAPMCWSRGQRWVAERVRGLDPGLHTVITANLSELREALRWDHGSTR